ncbi:MAG: hypothetical protein GY841_15385 [FCB group bacterium]|nr:hypothetical protein [FCB group bacterium]
MAVPTITSITPDNGLTRGLNMIQINGTGFSMPPDPPLDTAGPSFQSIKVTFGSVQSLSAFAITPVLAVAVVPTYTSDSMPESGDAVPVTLTNLDSAGSEIVGENVTFNSYTYKRPLFTTQQLSEYVLNRFVSYLRRHIASNVWMTMGRSFSEGNDQLNEKIKQAKLPLIWINGIDFEFNKLAQPMKNQEYLTSSTAFSEFRPPTTVDIVMSSIQIYSRSEHPREIYALSQAFLNTLRDIPKLICNPPGYDTEKTEYKYPMSIPDDGAPSFDLGPENDGLKVCTVGCIIEEVDLADLSGTLTGLGWTVEEDPEIDFYATT